MTGKGVLVDSNIILDVFTDDPNWADWSESMLEEYSNVSTLYINSIVYSEISIGFNRIEDLESAIIGAGFQMLDFPKEALFLAGKAFLKYKKKRGARSSPFTRFFHRSTSRGAQYCFRSQEMCHAIVLISQQ